MRKDGAKSTNGTPAQWATNEKPLADDVDPPLQPPHANVDVAHGSEHVEARTRTAADHKMWWHKNNLFSRRKQKFSRGMIAPSTLARAPTSTSFSVVTRLTQ